MAPQRLLLFLLLLLLFCAGAVCAKVSTLGESVELKADKQCGSAEKSALKTRDGSQIVARLVHGVWEAEEGYKHRVQHLSPSSVLLKRVNINDNGAFEFFCGSDVVTTIQLKVCVPSSTSAARGQTVTLPCHSFTAGRDVKPVKWEKEGNLVCEVNTSKQKITYGSGFEEKVSVSPDCRLTGNVSLILEDVQPRLQGMYTCYTQDEHGRELIVAVNLTVTSSSPDQTTTCLNQTSSTPEPQAKCHTWIGVSVLLLIVCAVLGGVLLVLLTRRGPTEGPVQGPRVY